MTFCKSAVGAETLLSSSTEATEADRQIQFPSQHQETMSTDQAEALAYLVKVQHRHHIVGQLAVRDLVFSINIPRLSQGLHKLWVGSQHFIVDRVRA